MARVQAPALLAAAPGSEGVRAACALLGTRPQRSDRPHPHSRGSSLSLGRLLPATGPTPTLPGPFPTHPARPPPPPRGNSRLPGSRRASDSRITSARAAANRRPVPARARGLPGRAGRPGRGDGAAPGTLLPAPRTLRPSAGGLLCPRRPRQRACRSRPSPSTSRPSSPGGHYARPSPSAGPPRESRPPRPGRGPPPQPRAARGRRRGRQDAAAAASPPPGVPGRAPSVRAAGSGRCGARGPAPDPSPPCSAAPSPRPGRSGASRPCPPPCPSTHRGSRGARAAREEREVVGGGLGPGWGAWRVLRAPASGVLA